MEIVGVHLISVPGYPPVHLVGFDRQTGRGVVAAHFTGARLVETASQVRSGRVQTYLLMVQTAGPPGTVDAVAGFRIDYVADRSPYSFTIRSGVILTAPWRRQRWRPAVALTPRRRPLSRRLRPDLLVGPSTSWPLVVSRV
ncbi:MAG: hypothetical protein HKL89_06050 [Candidatus Dormibacteraeota bacterium]|nr:hypothetical protein [Candidatus Dormibacteraeota bacterium]